MFLSTKNNTERFYPAAELYRSVLTGLNWIKNPYDALDKLSQIHGKAFWLNLPMFGRVFVAGTPSLIEAIRKTPALSGGLGMTFLRPVIGEDSVIMLHGSEHKCRRHLLAPLFSELFLERAEELTEIYAKEAIRNADGIISAHSLFSKINLRVITELLVPKELEEQRLDISTAVERFLKSFSNPMFLFAKPLQISFKGLTPWDKLQKNRRDLIKLIEPTLPMHPIFGQIDKDIAIEEIIALILFGHETAASGGAWFVYHLLSHPGITKNLFEESAPSPAWEAAVNESLRLCPVVVHLTRVAVEDVVLRFIDEHGKETSVQIKKGEKVLPCTYLSQRDPLVFPEPEIFDPSRFAKGETPYRNSFFPFGFGTRICIGKQIAIRQMQIIASLMLSSRSVTLVKKDLKPERNQVVIMPESGCLVRFD
jgi:cytochrome P450